MQQSAAVFVYSTPIEVCPSFTLSPHLSSYFSFPLPHFSNFPLSPPLTAFPYFPYPPYFSFPLSLLFPVASITSFLILLAFTAKEKSYLAYQWTKFSYDYDSIKRKLMTDTYLGYIILLLEVLYMVGE